MLFRDVATQGGPAETVGGDGLDSGEGEMQMSNSQESFVSAVSTNAVAFETRMAELYSSPTLLTPSWARDDILYFPTGPQNLFSDAAVAANPSQATITTTSSNTNGRGTMSYTASVTAASGMAGRIAPLTADSNDTTVREKELTQQRQVTQSETMEGKAMQADMLHALCGLSEWPASQQLQVSTQPVPQYEQQQQQQEPTTTTTSTSVLSLLRQSSDTPPDALSGQNGIVDLKGYDKIRFIPYPSLDELQAMRMATTTANTTTGKAMNDVDDFHQACYYDASHGVFVAAGPNGNSSSLPTLNSNTNNNTGVVHYGMAESLGTASAGLQSGNSSIAPTPASLSTCGTPYLRDTSTTTANTSNAPTIKLFIGGLRFEIVHAGRHAVRWIFEVTCQVRLQVNHILIHRKTRTGQRNSPHSVTPTGCASVFVTSEADAVALLAMHQRIYCAREGVYVAESASAMREFMLRENLVTYKGKVRGPTHPMVIERATSTGGVGHNHHNINTSNAMPQVLHLSGHDSVGAVPVTMPMMTTMRVMSDFIEDTTHLISTTASSSLASEGGYTTSSTANSGQMWLGRMPLSQSGQPPMLPPPAYSTMASASCNTTSNHAMMTCGAVANYAHGMTPSALQSFLLPHGTSEAAPAPYSNNHTSVPPLQPSTTTTWLTQPVTVRMRQYSNTSGAEMGCTLRFVPLPSDAALAEFAETHAATLASSLRPHSHSPNTLLEEGGVETDEDEGKNTTRALHNNSNIHERIKRETSAAEERSASLVTLFVGGLAPGSSALLVSWLFAHFDVSVPPSQVALLLTPCTMSAHGTTLVQPCAVVQLPASAVNTVMAYHKRVLCTSQGVWFADSSEELATVMANEPNFADYYAFHVERRLGALQTTTSTSTTAPPLPTPCAALPFPSAHLSSALPPPPPPPLGTLLSQYNFPSAGPSLATCAAACVPYLPPQGMNPAAPPAYHSGSSNNNNTNGSNYTAHTLRGAPA